jgi:hypothetical protein
MELIGNRLTEDRIIPLRSRMMGHVGFGATMAVVDWETTQMLIDHPQFKQLWQTPTGYMFPLDMRLPLESGMLNLVLYLVHQ